ncbi:MAG: hypothetical protein AAB368_03415 [bacterium]
MTLTNLEFGTLSRAADQVTPAAQASTNTLTVVAGSALDASVFGSLGYTMKNTGAQSINYEVWAGNASDFSDEVQIVSATTILAGAAASYSVSPPPFRYYRVKEKSTVNDLHGAMTLRGVAR